MADHLRLATIDDEEIPDQPTSREHDDAQKLVAQIISGMISLKHLSLKAAVAVSNILTLIEVLSVGGLWYVLLQSPDAYKLVGGGIFSWFVLMIEWIRRRK